MATGKLADDARRRSPGRIGAIVLALNRHMRPRGRLVEVGHDRAAILMRALAALPDIAALGIELQPAAARMTIPESFLERLTLVTGDGFDPVPAPSARDIALLAGMGGRTIAEILTRTPAVTRAFGAVVVCPSHLEADVRPALTALGLAIADERLAYERDRFYEIIVARPDASAPDAPAPAAARSDLDAVVAAAWGPRLFADNDPLLVPFLEDAKARFHAALAEGLRSYLASDDGPKAALGRKLAHLEAALARARTLADDLR